MNFPFLHIELDLYIVRFAVFVLFVCIVFVCVCFFISISKFSAYLYHLDVWNAMYKNVRFFKRMYVYVMFLFDMYFVFVASFAI